MRGTALRAKGNPRPQNRSHDRYDHTALGKASTETESGQRTNIRKYENLVFKIELETIVLN